MGDKPQLTRRLDQLSEAIARTIEDHFARAGDVADWPQDLEYPVLRVDAFLEEQGPKPLQDNAPYAPLRVASVRTVVVLEPASFLLIPRD